MNIQPLNIPALLGAVTWPLIAAVAFIVFWRPLGDLFGVIGQRARKFSFRGVWLQVAEVSEMKPQFLVARPLDVGLVPKSGSSGITGLQTRPVTANRTVTHQRGDADLKSIICIIAAIVVVSLFVITWPASLALSLVLLMWFCSRKSDSPIGRSVHEAALPVLIGTGLFWIVSVVVALVPRLSDNGSQWLFEAEQTLLQARLVVHALSGPNLTVYLLILGLLLVLLCFFPKSRAIGRLIRTKKQLASLHLCLLALTSFTFFGARSADERAQKGYEKGVQELTISLQTELDAAKKSLPTMLANEAVLEALKTPIPPPNKTQLLYLIKSFREPMYVEVPHAEAPDAAVSGLREFPDVGSHPIDLLGGSSAFKSKGIQIASSSLIKTIIDDFSKEIQAQEKASQSDATSLNNVEEYARQLLGRVAESPEAQQRQETLINEEGVRAAQSKERYKEVSTGVTEAVMTTFSEALGILPFMTPAAQDLAKDNEAAKEWITVLIEEVIVPFFERSIGRHVESVIGWFRRSLTGSPIQDVPDQLRRELQLTPAVAKRFLFPSFLAGKEPSSPALEGEKISDNTAREILRRKEDARKEIEAREYARNEIDAQIRSGNASSLWPRNSEDLDPERTIRERQRLRQREFRPRGW